MEEQNVTTARSIGRQQAVKSQQILLLITLKGVYISYLVQKKKTQRSWLCPKKGNSVTERKGVS